MANVLALLHALLAASSPFSLLPLVLLLVIAILIILVFSIVAFRLVPLMRQAAELAYRKAIPQRESNGCKKALNALAEDSACTSTPSAKTSPGVEDLSRRSPAPAPAPFVDPETKVQALEARLEFLRDSCRIMVARKTDMLEEKDSLLARQSADLATLKAQLAAIHQTKNELLAEKDACCKAILAQKTDELAALGVQLNAAHQTVATVATERDEAVARADTIANELEKTHVDYSSKITFLTTRATDAESGAAALQTTVQQQETDIGDILLKNNNLSMEIALLTKRLETASRQRTTPSSPRYSFQSFMSPRSSESASDSSFDSDRPSPSSPWRRFTIRLARKSSKP